MSWIVTDICTRLDGFEPPLNRFTLPVRHRNRHVHAIVGHVLTCHRSPISAPTPLVASAPVFIPKLGTDGSPVFASLAPAINVSRSQSHSVQPIVPEPISHTPQTNEVHDAHENNGYEQYEDVHDSNEIAGSYYDTGHGLDYRGQVSLKQRQCDHVIT